MASTHRAPKQWCLTKTESVNSFENWKQNLQYTLSLDPSFSRFLVDGTQWLKKTRASPLRGFANDGEDIAEAKRLTAAQKVTLLDLMLGQVANYCPVISRNTIVKNSTSLTSIWQDIRMHYGFHSTGAHLIDFADIKLEAQERPEDLYQRLTAFVEDNLLKQHGGITHYGDLPVEDEEVSPTLENLIVLIWLRLLHSDLPRLVKQRYGTELRSRTLASIKPEISQALNSLLDEAQTTEDVRIMRSATFNPRANPRSNRPRSQIPHTGNYQRKTQPFPSTQIRPYTKVCPLCKQVGRPDFNHFLSECVHLPESDRRFMIKTRQVASDDPYSGDTLDTYEDDISEVEPPTSEPHSRRVNVKQSPYFRAFFTHYPLTITLDSGAETNMIKTSVAHYIGARITKSSQVAIQADGLSPLSISGETQLTLSRGPHEFHLEALVVENLDVDILAGVPFMVSNDISVRPARHEITLQDGTTYTYGIDQPPHGPHVIRRTQSYVLRAPPSTTTVWPGEFIEVDSPAELSDSPAVALEPRTDSPSLRNSPCLWPEPHFVTAVDNNIRILNTTTSPVVLKKNEHFCRVSPLIPPMTPDDQHYPPLTVPGQSASTLSPHTTSYPPDAVGVSFAADVIRRERQFIIVVRECVTSYTRACFIPNEQCVSLREALISLCIELQPQDGPPAIIRTDPTPGFAALVNDPQLLQFRLCLEIGRVKNPNKNPVAERAVQELEDELLRQEPLGGPVSTLTLSIAVARLNSRIRSTGLSARELWTQRDGFTNAQLSVPDKHTLQAQHDRRTRNHPHSEKSKAPFGKVNMSSISVGDLIYLYADRNKSRARDRSLVVDIDGPWCNVRKFTGSQLRNSSYRVKQSECYMVPSTIPDPSHSRNHEHVASDDEEISTPPVNLPSTIPTSMQTLDLPEPPPGTISPHQQPLPLAPPVPPPPDVCVPPVLSTPATPPVDVAGAYVEPNSRTMDTNTTASMIPRRSSRSRHPPKYLDDFTMY